MLIMQKIPIKIDIVSHYYVAFLKHTIITDSTIDIKLFFVLYRFQQQWYAGGYFQCFHYFHVRMENMTEKFTFRLLYTSTRNNESSV